MGKIYERIDDRLRAFIEEQHVFFAATAPLASDGHVNVSPKGLAGSFAVLDETTVGYLDLGGSGAETIAHLRENGRVTLMWCAFGGPPRIVRIHGTGRPVFRDDPRWAELLPYFGPGMRKRTDLRAVITVSAERISDTCGFAVPFMECRGTVRCTRSASPARPTNPSPHTARRRSTSASASTDCPRCPCLFRRSPARADTRPTPAPSP